MRNLIETLPLVLVLLVLLSLIAGFIKMSMKLRKGGGSMTTVVLGSTDQFLTKDRLRAAETIISENAHKKFDEVKTEGTGDRPLNGTHLKISKKSG